MNKWLNKEGLYSNTVCLLRQARWITVTCPNPSDTSRENKEHWGGKSLPSRPADSPDCSQTEAFGRIWSTKCPQCRWGDCGLLTWTVQLSLRPGRQEKKKPFEGQSGSEKNRTNQKRFSPAVRLCVSCDPCCHLLEKGPKWKRKRLFLCAKPMWCHTKFSVSLKYFHYFSLLSQNFCSCLVLFIHSYMYLFFPKEIIFALHVIAERTASLPWPLHCSWMCVCLERLLPYQLCGGFSSHSYISLIQNSLVLVSCPALPMSFISRPIKLQRHLLRVVYWSRYMIGHAHTPCIGASLCHVCTVAHFSL